MISLDAKTYFTPEVVERLRKNLKTLEKAKPGYQLCNSDNDIYLDNRWSWMSAPQINLDPKAISWTLENMHLALQAAKSLNLCQIKDRQSLEENVLLMKVVGKIRMLNNLYFKRFKNLKKTYHSLEGGIQLIAEIVKIKKTYRPRINDAIKELTAIECERQSAKEEIPEIPLE